MRWFLENNPNLQQTVLSPEAKQRELPMLAKAKAAL